MAFVQRSAVQEKRTCNLFFNFVKSRIIMEEKTMIEILVEKGGIDIQGNLCLEEDDYKKAELL